MTPPHYGTARMLPNEQKVPDDVFSNILYRMNSAGNERVPFHFRRAFSLHKTSLTFQPEKIPSGFFPASIR